MEKFDFSALLKIHEKRHKRKPTQFSSVAGGVKNRLQNNLNRRKSTRLTDFDNFRNLPSCASPAPLSKAQEKAEHRRQQLEKWKSEKDKQKKEQNTQKKKPFLTGVPHNPLKYVPPPPIPMPSTSGRVTRSQTSQNKVSRSKKQEKEQKQIPTQSFAPKNAIFKPPQLKTNPPPLALNKPKKKTKMNITFDPILPVQQKDVRLTRSKTSHTKQPEKEARGKTSKQNNKIPKIIKYVAPSSSSSNSQSSTSLSESDQQLSPVLKSTRKPICTLNKPVRNKTPRKSIQGSKQFTPKNRVPKSESSSEERLRSPKSPVEEQRTPEQIIAEAKKFSPCITMSRGKDNARKEMKKKMDEGLLDEDGEASEPAAVVAQFRRQLASETERISSLCRHWDDINNNLLPDAVQECILGAVGQARLLMSQKLAQFSQLVERCARPEDDTTQALVTCADLHGFWDMVFLQVVNVDMRFRKLEEMRARNWTDEQVEVKRKVSKPAAKKVVKPAGGNSKLREMIAAARKAKKEEEDQAKSPAPKSPAQLTVEPASKTFEAGFFCVKSPVRSPIIGTPKNKSLLKAVLSSEAKKASASKNCASFAMLRASVLGKAVEFDGIAHLPQSPQMTPVNLDATPARSILKSKATSQSGKKNIKMVLFNQSADQSPLSPNSQNKEMMKETDSGLSSMDVDPENKENPGTKAKLRRQDAIELSPIMTRGRRKSLQTPIVDAEVNSTKRSGRKVLQGTDVTETGETPKRSSRRRKSGRQS